MSAETINSYEQSIELVERFAQCLLNDCKTKNDLVLVEQLAPYITYFSNEIQMTKSRDQIYENFVKKVDSASEKPNCDTILKEFNEELHNASKQLRSHDKCSKYINFMKMISQQNFADDGEIKAVSESVNTIDPISKLPIVNPVKNRKCGHTYEESTILQLLEQNPRTKCPIAGCNATDFVKKNDLVPDNALKRMLSNTNFNPQKKLKLHK